MVKHRVCLKDDSRGGCILALLGSLIDISKSRLGKLTA